MEYKEFLKTKQRNIIDSGFEVDQLNENLFDFQKFIVKKALKAGKYAVFADTGLGKTIIQLSWANQVSNYCKKPVLILAPLAVSLQTIEEGVKFGIDVKKVSMVNGMSNNGVYISNYEQINNLRIDNFIGIVLDESSILKNEVGKYRDLIIEKCKKVPYKLACTATPSPNDPMELGNHSEFLDVMNYKEMLAMFFVHDGDNTSKWRLKGHAIEKFYEFVSTWAIMLTKPSDIGFSDDRFELPKLYVQDLKIETKVPDGLLFGGLSVNATDYNKKLRDTQRLRIESVVNLVDKLLADEDPQIIIWCHQNSESDQLFKILSKKYDCRNVKGSDSVLKKEKDLLGFAHNEFNILITKPKIAQFGLNYQNCNYQIFASVDFSFESTYQAIRRSWRFLQKNDVYVWLIITDNMENISEIQNKKYKQFKKMQFEMSKAMNRNLNNKLTVNVDSSLDVKTDNYWIMKGDSVQRVKELEENSVDLIVFSPPFADLYTYSNYVEDMGNVSDYNEFVEHFKYLATELKRIIKPGRLIAIHCMDLPTLKSREGYIGIRRFSSIIGDIFEDLDMFLHSEFIVWKDPLLAAVRTKTIGLAHKQVTKDMSIIRAGLPDKILCFKTKEENETPIQLDDIKFTYYKPMHTYDNFPISPNDFNEFHGYDPKSKYSKEEQYSHLVWQRYASPVWMDINQTNTLQYTTARDKNDEKHICPLQLEVIERLILLYSNRGETIFCPFGGIGSEGYQALKMGRKSISIELKGSYFNVNVKNHKNAIEEKSQLQMF